jgi:hypothetical protein
MDNVDSQIDINKTQAEHTQSAGGSLVNGAVMQTVTGIVNKLQTMNPLERQQTLTQLQQQSPQQFNAVIQQMNGVDLTPQPTVKPPRRDQK